MMHLQASEHLTYDVLDAWATTRQAPLWICISLYALSHADPTGRLTLKRGELRDRVDPLATPTQVWQAVKRAIDAGWILEGSTTTELRVK